MHANDTNTIQRARISLSLIIGTTIKYLTFFACVELSKISGHLSLPLSFSRKRGSSRYRKEDTRPALIFLSELGLGGCTMQLIAL